MRFLIWGILCMSLFFSSSAVFSNATDENCSGTGCITSENFLISVWDITPGGTSLIDETGWTQGTVNNALTKILEKLILIFGAIAVLIMTIGAWYMIIYHGQDEFLSKGKSIFISWLVALAVALSAGLIVQLFSRILYGA